MAPEVIEMGIRGYGPPVSEDCCLYGYFLDPIIAESACSGVSCSGLIAESACSGVICSGFIVKSTYIGVICFPHEISPPLYFEIFKFVSLMLILFSMLYSYKPGIAHVI